MKVHLLSIVIGAACLTTAYGMTTKKQIEVDFHTKGITINHQILRFPQNQEPFTVDSNTALTVDETVYIPLTFFAESLGFKVENYLDNYININGGDVVRYKTQSTLLKDAMEYVGVNNPEKAVEVWSEGLKGRSAATQYSVMTKELKEIYAKDLEEWRPNWVTGGSSPRVESYEITGAESPNEDSRIYDITYNTTNSVQEYNSFTVELEVVHTGDFWRIAKVSGDEDSKIYTGFR